MKKNVSYKCISCISVCVCVCVCVSSLQYFDMIKDKNMVHLKLTFTAIIHGRFGPSVSRAFLGLFYFFYYFRSRAYLYVYMFILAHVCNYLLLKPDFHLIVRRSSVMIVQSFSFCLIS